MRFGFRGRDDRRGEMRDEEERGGEKRMGRTVIRADGVGAREGKDDENEKGNSGEETSDLGGESLRRNEREGE